MKQYVIGLMIGIGLGILIATTPSLLQDPPKEQTTTPCDCLSYYQVQYYSTKRDILINKRKRTPEEKDSITKYERLLGIDETQNIYPEK